MRLRRFRALGNVVRVLIRREIPGDAEQTRAVVAAAFTTPVRPGDPPEAVLLDELRADGAWMPALSWVALDSGGSVIGHVLGTRGHVGDTPVVALGPVAVRPDHQRRGVGSALVHAVIGAADALDEPLIALLGEPAYYSRFGFHLGTEYAVDPPVPDWRPYFQVRTLTRYRTTMTGTFRYPSPFDRV